MKARVKATGEIIEVNKVTSYSKDFEVLVYYKGDDGFPYKEEQLDFEDLTQGKADVKEKSLPKNEPDYWEKLKHQYAGMFTKSFLDNCDTSVDPEQIIDDAINMATSLVIKLKLNEES
ncbi:MAG: hypothetical protein J6A59_03390 [Lachnospiraceae bacterium]|nr:hypothetical protein [Lachnospiraceae bacterium]